MPTIPLADGSRFAVITSREAPDAETGLPLAFDPAAVVAVEAKGSGRFALHLAGGQTLLLTPAIAAAALKRLGLEGEKSKCKIQISKRKMDARAEAPRVKRAEPRVKRARSAVAENPTLLSRLGLLRTHTRG